MKGRWKMLKEGGRLSAGFNWMTILCLLSLPPILFSLFRCWHPDYHKRRRLPCRCWFAGSLNQSISKVKINSKGFKLPLLRPLTTLFPPSLSLTHVLLPQFPSLPFFFSLYFNLSEKWKGRPLNFIASRKLWQVFIVVPLFPFNLSAGGLSSWHLYIWRPALKLPLTPLDELHCDLGIWKHPWQIFLIDTCCNRDQPVHRQPKASLIP